MWGESPFPKGKVPSRNTDLGDWMVASTAERLKDHIVYEFEQQLANGKLRPGDKFPSEHELVRRYKVNRYVVQRAVRELENNGRVTASQGRGRFVSLKRFEITFSQLSEYPAPVTTDWTYHSTQQSLLKINAKPDLAKSLQTEQQAPVAYVKRLIYFDNIPVAVSRQYLRLDRLPDFFDAFERCGGSVSHAVAASGIKRARHKSRKLTSRLPTQEETQLINMPSHTPILEFQYQSADDVSVFEMASFYLPSDRISIAFD